VRRPERHQGLDVLVTALALHVVAGEQAAEAVPHDVHPLVPGLLADAIQVHPEVGRPARDVGQPAAQPSAGAAR